MSDLIRREDAIKALCDAVDNKGDYEGEWLYTDEFCKAIDSVPSADRPNEVIYGNEHNCIMTMFGECSYAETGCGDCAVVEKVRKALSADRTQGEWIEKEIFGEYNDDVHHYVSEWQSARCSVCGKYHTTPYAYYFDEYNFCPSCGARMKGADDGSTL